MTDSTLSWTHHLGGSDGFRLKEMGISTQKSQSVSYS